MGRECAGKNATKWSVDRLDVVVRRTADNLRAEGIQGLLIGQARASFEKSSSAYCGFRTGPSVSSGNHRILLERRLKKIIAAS